MGWLGFKVFRKMGVGELDFGFFELGSLDYGVLPGLNYSFSSRISIVQIY